MGHQIIKQPDGKYCVWSTIVEGLILENVTKDDLLHYYLDRAVLEEKQKLAEILKNVDAGTPEQVYLNTVITYDEVKGKRGER